MWDLPGQGLEPLSPALAGGFLTTAPTGKSLSCYLNLNSHLWLVATILHSAGTEEEITFGRSLGLSFLIFIVKGWTLKLTLFCEDGGML